MAKVDLGMKLTCESCGARFYDLNKQPGVCPKCGTANARPVIFKASRRPSAEEREKAASLAAKAAAKPAPDEDAVDELHIYQAPILVGGAQSRSTFGGEGRSLLANAWRGKIVEELSLGHDRFVRVVRT